MNTTTTDRVDVVDGYAQFPTATGTLPQCIRCGALVGDRVTHDDWHDLEGPRTWRELLRLRRRHGGRPLGLS